ncbi:MAG: hypothetical protein AB7P69_14090 [Candidatus Binatia bacterium]
MRRYTWMFAVAVLFVSSFAKLAHGGSLSAEQQKALDSSKYVYIQSTRADGSLGKPAEIWFMHHEGAVWVCSPTTTYRVKRIQAGKTEAKIAIGKPDGPSFKAKGSVVKDAEVNKALYESFAKKYADGWSSYEKQFKEGLANGSRTLVKYDPE